MGGAASSIRLDDLFDADRKAVVDDDDFANETDFLNGEIVLLGRVHGVPTPVNEVLQRLANRMAAAGDAPGSLTVEQVEALVAEGA